MPSGQTSTFDIYPAIDLRAGRVVRLTQGDFEREQVYDDDPASVARAFTRDGARWLHVVDLDGARGGERRQSSTVTEIVAAVRQGDDRQAARVRVQVAGGIRTAEAIADVLAGGADRAVLGTAAIRDPRLVSAAVSRHGAARIAVALDVRDGIAVGDGWVRGAPGAPFELAVRRLADAGIETFVVTAIERDGLLGGPDLTLLETAVRSTAVEVIASGGIASLADLSAIRAIGCRGAIVGRALYDARIDLPAALAVTR